MTLARPAVASLVSAGVEICGILGQFVSKVRNSNSGGWEKCVITWQRSMALISASVYFFGKFCGRFIFNLFTF
jgi:hypothetical protein